MVALIPPALIRPAKPGDASCVSYLHIKLYQSLYGFKPIFECYVMRGLADFLREPEGGRLWVAEAGGMVIGSVAVVKAGAGTAQLRWFIVEQGWQGLGLGGRLMQTAIEFCHGQGYQSVFLWTVDILEAARHIYQSHGFALKEQKANDDWASQPVREERWELRL